MDKLLHLLCNFTIVIIIGLINIYLAVILAVVISIGKELYDSKVDYKDLIADAIGILLGLVIL